MDAIITNLPNSRPIIAAAVALDSVLLTALDRNPQERRFILESEQKLITFVNQTKSNNTTNKYITNTNSSTVNNKGNNQEYLDFEPAPSFQRKLLHLLCQRFNLGRDVLRYENNTTTTSNELMILRIYRITQSTLPSIFLKDMVILAEHISKSLLPSSSSNDFISVSQTFFNSSKRSNNYSYPPYQYHSQQQQQQEANYQPIPPNPPLPSSLPTSNNISLQPPLPFTPPVSHNYPPPLPAPPLPPGSHPTIPHNATIPNNKVIMVVPVENEHTKRNNSEGPYIITTQPHQQSTIPLPPTTYTTTTPNPVHLSTNSSSEETVVNHILIPTSGPSSATTNYPNNSNVPNNRFFPAMVSSPGPVQTINTNVQMQGSYITNYTGVPVPENNHYIKDQFGNLIPALTTPSSTTTVTASPMLTPTSLHSPATTIYQPHNPSPYSSNDHTIQYTPYPVHSTVPNARYSTMYVSSTDPRYIIHPKWVTSVDNSSTIIPIHHEEKSSVIVSSSSSHNITPTKQHDYGIISGENISASNSPILQQSSSQTLTEDQQQIAIQRHISVSEGGSVIDDTQEKSHSRVDHSTKQTLLTPNPPFLESNEAISPTGLSTSQVTINGKDGMDSNHSTITLPAYSEYTSKYQHSSVVNVPSHITNPGMNFVPLYDTVSTTQNENYLVKSATEYMSEIEARVWQATVQSTVDTLTSMMQQSAAVATVSSPAVTSTVPMYMYSPVANPNSTGYYVTSSPLPPPGTSAYPVVMVQNPSANQPINVNYHASPMVQPTIMHVHGQPSTNIVTSPVTTVPYPPTATYTTNNPTIMQVPYNPSSLPSVPNRNIHGTPVWYPNQ